MRDFLVQILFPLRGERISNLIDFSREFFPIAGWEFFLFFLRDFLFNARFAHHVALT